MRTDRVRRQDLTALARIREAALAHFPRHGFAGTTIRRIAADAGVSPALVVHHFGSKEGLRRACDRYVIEEIRAVKTDAISGHTLTQAPALVEAFQAVSPLLRYLAWALSSGSDPAAALFDELVEEATRLMELAEEHGYLRSVPEKRQLVGVLLAMQLGSLVLHPHLERTLGVDPLSPQGAVEMSRVALILLSGALFPHEVAEDMSRALTEAEALMERQ